MKRIGLLLTLWSAFLLTGSRLQAQNFLLKIGGGVSAHTQNSRVMSSLMAGLGYEYEFSQHWGITPGIFLQAKGWKEHDTDVVYDKFTTDYDTPDQNPDWNPETSTYRTGKMGDKTTLTYLTLSVPLNYYIRTGTGNYVILSAGPFASVGVKAKREVKGDPFRPNSQERLSYINHGFNRPERTLRRMDGGIIAQVAYQFGNGITVGMQGDFSLVPSIQGIKASRNISGMVTLSYNFHQGNSYRQRIIDSLYE